MGLNVVLISRTQSQLQQVAEEISMHSYCKLTNINIKFNQSEFIV